MRQAIHYGAYTLAGVVLFFLATSLVMAQESSSTQPDDTSHSVALPFVTTDDTQGQQAQEAEQTPPEPDSTDVYKLFAPLVLDGGPPDAETSTLCGADNRVVSPSSRVGRLGVVGNPFCTAWLAANGSLVTAGHCVDFDPDRGGPLVPDGVLDLGDTAIVEFNVPASGNIAGADATNPAAATDVYSVTLGSVRWEYAGEGNSFGEDWAVFRVERNFVTKLTPFEAQGDFHRVTEQRPNNGDTIRITGFGVDTGNDNQTLQFSTGPYVTQADLTRHLYQVDTMGANSGSAIWWSDEDYVVGIHTNGGCQADGTGANSGTSFDDANLQQAMNRVQGTDTVYVDSETFAGVTEAGTIFAPYNRVTEAVNAVDEGRIVSIVAGTYNESITIDTPMTLIAPVGTVTIVGQ